MAGGAYRNRHLIRAAMRAGRSAFSRGTRSRRNGVSKTTPLARVAPSENTFQHDVQPLYRRRPMPRRRRRRWIRRKRGFDNMLNMRVPMRTFVKTTTHFLGAGTDSQQFEYSIAGGSLTTVGDREGNDDLNDIANLSRNTTPNADASIVANKVFLKSVQLETIIRNLSDVLVFLDVYRIYARKDTASVDFSTTYDEPVDIRQILTRGASDQAPVGGVNTVNLLNHGATPFQISRFCSLFKIVSKTRYRLEPGSTVQIHMNRRYNRTYDFSKMRNMVYTRAFTTGFLFVFYGSPGATGDEGVYSQAANLRFVRNVVYSYRVLDEDQQRPVASFQSAIIP